jgi:hypothetical protein
LEDRKWDYVWTAGCSHSVKEFAPGLKSWNNRIADRLKLPCKNFALSGGSNMRITRLLERDFILEKKDDRTPLILIGCTEFTRVELYIIHEWIGFSVSSNLGASNTLLGKIDTYLKAIYPKPAFREHAALHNMFMLKGVLDYINYDYLVVPMFDYKEFTNHANANFPDFLLFDKPFMQFCRTGPYISIDEGFHYGNTAHDDWSEIVYEKLEKKFNVEI